MTDFTPTREQAEALLADPPLLILAGAGTGKTTVVTHRIANLIADGKARPDQVLALTFAEKAAAEMGERLATLLEDSGHGDAGRDVKCATFHSFGLEVVQEYALLLGMEADSRVISTPESWQLLSKVVDGMDYEAIELPMGGLGSVLGGMLGFFSAAKDHLVGPQDIFDSVSSQELSGLSDIAREYWQARLSALSEVAETYRRYEDAKRERNLVDFGDLLTLPVRLFNQHSEVRDGFRRRYPYLFVDEYQDTNYVQKVLLVDHLVSEEARIVVIGDDDQSIYGWRGAVIRNILAFLEEEAVKHRKPTRKELTLNRRSGQEILDAANLIISGLPEHRRYQKKLRPQDDAPAAAVRHCIAATDETEAAWIADTIKNGRGNEEYQDPTGKKSGYGVFAVLCRKRSLFSTIARALDAAGVPYELVGGTGFFGRWEIRDILSYLRVLANPADNIALARVLQSASWKLNHRELYHLSEWAQSQARRRKSERRKREAQAQAESQTGEVPSGRSADGSDGVDDTDFRLIDALANFEVVPGLSGEARERLVRLRSLLDNLSRDVHRMSIGDLVERLIGKAGYWRELSAREGYESQVARLNLQKLVELARQFQGAEASLDAFVEYIQYALESGGDEDEVRPLDEGSDAVKIMTIHQAKGLEFPCVFVPGLAEKLFPDPRVDDPDRWDQLPEQLRGDKDDFQPLDLTAITTEKELSAALSNRKERFRERELEEERRLCYVAFTRAQRVLYLSRAHWYFSNSKPRGASTYWDEVVGEDAHASVLSTLVHEEDDPGFNPRLLPSNGAAAKRTAREKSLSRLMLDPDRGAGWIQNTAVSDPAEWRERVERVERRLGAIGVTLRTDASCEPAVVSCSGLIQYRSCPRLYRYLYVDALPGRPMPWASYGTEMHRRIEELARPGEEDTAAKDDEDVDREEDDDDPTGGHPTALGEMLSVYRNSPFGKRRATRVEEPFGLPLGENRLVGRIDRLDRVSETSWELADFKAGRFHGELLPRQHTQMQLYALAAWRLWGIEPEHLTCHVMFLADGHDAAITFLHSELEDTERKAAEALDAIRLGHFPRDETWIGCPDCDYRCLCEAQPL